MTKPDALGEVETRIARAQEMVVALCRRRGTEGAREWVMSIPARRSYDPDLVIGDALRDAKALVAVARAAKRVESVTGDYLSDVGCEGGTPDGSCRDYFDPDRFCGPCRVQEPLLALRDALARLEEPR